MKISELPTPRLRARAMELALEDRVSVGDTTDIGNLDLDIAFEFFWGDTKEGSSFWDACDEGNWDKAKELQPSLFKPMDGKPHIKLVTEIYSSDDEDIMDCSLEVTNWYSVDKDILERIDEYIYSVNLGTYPTIKEAVEALYSFKRLPVVDKENQ